MDFFDSSYLIWICINRCTVICYLFVPACSSPCSDNKKPPNVHCDPPIVVLSSSSSCSRKMVSISLEEHASPACTCHTKACNTHTACASRSLRGHRLSFSTWDLDRCAWYLPRESQRKPQPSFWELVFEEPFFLRNHIFGFV